MATKRRKSPAAQRNVDPGNRASLKNRTMTWFIAGALAGGLVTWAAVGRDPAAEQVRTAIGQPIEVDPATPPPKTTYEFYTLLPEMEVVVPEEESVAARKPPPPRDDSTSKPGAAPAPDQPGQADQAGHYVVQVASFRSSQEADALKARLTLIGLEPVVQSVAISDEEKWYRVRLGPYADRDFAEAARVQLRASGHDKLLVVWVQKG